MTKKPSIFEMVLIILAPAVLASTVAIVCCGPTTPQEKKGAAEATYGAELQQCVDRSTSRAEADVCAERVRAKWSPDGGAK